eukprot:TRINITY_DN687_c1_g1_i5.p1 TRINITY_DN687_c1_g1~~TRINITY_DN687_c1_g1_i5.p1  ORF type:complete len:137 (-),score=2.84 TRINITY_DN687_c1_g1_i5:27-437(-)
MSTFLEVVTERTAEPWIVPTYHDPKKLDFRQLYYFQSRRCFYVRKLSYFGSLSPLEREGSYTIRGNLETTHPFFQQENSVRYIKRPSGHCTACWQSRKAGNPWDHTQCSKALRAFVSDLSNYQLPSATINIHIENL